MRRCRETATLLRLEYHANSIRLRRVLLLRSYIRLMPSNIRSASFRTNRISLFAMQRISLYTNKKRENISAHKKPICSLFYVCNKGFGLAHLRLTSQMRCLHFCQSKNSPLRTSPYIPSGFIYIETVIK